MAYQQVTEHPYRTFIKQMKDSAAGGNYPRLILLYGKEDYLINWAKNALVSQLINPAVKVLDFARFSEENADIDAIIAACESYPIMSRKKLVLAENVEVSFEGKGAEELGRLASYFKDIPESTLLILTEKAPDKRRTYFKEASKHGLAYDFMPLDRGTLAGWMAKRLDAAGRSCSREDMLEFAYALGYGDEKKGITLYNLENEIIKTLAYTDKKQLCAADFFMLSQPGAETDAFKILDASFSGRKGEALTVLSNSVKSEMPSKQMGILLGLQALLCSQLEIMTEACERRLQGQSFPQILKEMGVNKYRLEKAMEAAGRRNAETLRKNLYDAYQIEKDIKGGLTDPYIALELFIAGL